MNFEAHLDTLEAEVRKLIVGQPIDRWYEELGPDRFLCLSTQRFGESRHLRIRADLGYSMHWSSFHEPIDHDEDGDGDRYAKDLDFIVRAIQGFLIDGRRWQELPELGG